MRECPTAPCLPALGGWGRALGALVLLVASVIVVPALGASPADAASRCGGAVPDGSIRVVVVVDDGQRAPNATCLVLGSGEQTGAKAWAARAAVLGTPAPRYSGSGLLCGIDGYPATGCGDRTASSYQYWAYFDGTSGSWVYGSGNPHIQRLQDGDILGWHFITGTGTDGDQPPRMAPSPSLFPPLPPPPTAAPAPAPSGPTGGGGVVPGPGPAAPGPAAPGPAGTPGTTDPGADPAAVDPAATEPPADTTVAPAADAPSTTTASATDELAATPASSAGSGGAGGTLGLVVGIVLIAALGGGAVLRARARR